MPKHFDNAIRFLQTVQPESWAKFLGLNARKVTACNTDLSTVTAAADFLLLLELDGLVGEHLESQASYEVRMGERTLFYNMLARKALNVSVNSTVLLLRKEADGPAMNGLVRLEGRKGSENIQFRFDVVRIWTIPAEQLFECGLGVLPFAFIGDIKTEELPGLVRRTQEVLDRETKPELAAEIWTAIQLLMGLRFEKEFIAGLLKGVRAMKESTTYQAILEEGVAKGIAQGKAVGEAIGGIVEARKLLLRVASTRFGEPDAKSLAALSAIGSIEQLEELVLRSLVARNWEELLKP